MKVFIPLLCLASLILAEPPVGDGYPAARSSHDHHVHDLNDLQDQHTSEHHRSLSQEYRPPSATSAYNTPTGYEYAPNKINSPNARGQPPFRPATVRVSFNQRFGSYGARSSAQAHNKPNGRNPSQKYAGNSRSGISQDYGPPAARSLSQDYGVPSIGSTRTLSTEYGVPDVKSTPSQEYSAPVIAARSNQKPYSFASNFRRAESKKALSQDYSSPYSRFQLDSQSEGYKESSARSNSVVQNYVVPKSDFSSRSVPSSTYGIPSDRSPSSSYNDPSARSPGYDSVSQTYSAPGQKDPSETYGTPRSRSLSQEYGVPSSRINLKTDDFAISSASSRSALSSTYLPSTQTAMPSQQYGVPENDNQGYENARNLNELLNQEPANYDFSYQIEDNESGSDFGHTETRVENRAEGSYFVVLPDGTKQTVEYEADEHGFKPRISVEPAAGGYDENAADITRTNGGPY